MVIYEPLDSTRTNFATKRNDQHNSDNPAAVPRRTKAPEELLIKKAGKFSMIFMKVWLSTQPNKTISAINPTKTKFTISQQY